MNVGSSALLSPHICQDRNPTGPSGISRRVNRSGGNSKRYRPVPNPIVSDRVILGEWRHSSATPRHAVVARYSSNGRFMRRIIASDVGGNPIAASPKTACAHELVDYLPHFQNLTHEQVRAEVDRILRVPRIQALP